MKNLLLGFKKAWDIPSLPQNVYSFYNHILLRYKNIPIASQ